MFSTQCVYVRFLCGSENKTKAYAEAVALKFPNATRIFNAREWIEQKCTLAEQSTQQNVYRASNDLDHFVANNKENEDEISAIVGDHIRESIQFAFNNLTPTQPAFLLITNYPTNYNESDQVVKLYHIFKKLAVNIRVIRFLEKKENTTTAATFQPTFKLWYESISENRFLENCNEFCFDFAGSLDDADALVLETLPMQLNVRDLAIQTTNPPIDGFVEATPIERASIVQMHMRLMGRNGRRFQFCGTHPISLDRENMTRLVRYPYLCALKIDGERYICAIRNGVMYLMNRKLRVWCTQNSIEQLRLVGECLFDCEKHGRNSLTVIDAFVISGQFLSQRPILERLAHMNGIVNLFAPSERRIVQMNVQTYLHRTQLNFLFRQNQTDSNVNYDGVIFQPEKLPVRVGIDFNLFKWKCATENTADLLWDGTCFKCRGTVDGGSGQLVSPPRGDQAYTCGKLQVDELQLEANVVYECTPKIVNQIVCWAPQRKRADKLYPNVDWVVDRILKSFEDNITRDELIRFCSQPTFPRNVARSPPKIRGRTHPY